MQAPRTTPKNSKPAYGISLIFGLWIGLQYWVVMAIRISVHSKQGETMDLSGIVAAILWPILFFAMSSYPLFPSNVRRGTAFFLVIFVFFCILSAFVSPGGFTSLAYVALTLTSIWISLDFISAMNGMQFERALKIYSILIISLLTAFAWYDYEPGTRLGNGKAIFNPNSIGLVSISGALSAMSFRNWIIRYALLIVALFIIYLTDSRASGIGALIGLSVIAFVRTRASNQSLKIFIIVTFILSLILSVIFWETLDPLVESFLQLRVEGRGLGSGATGRAEAWKQAWQIFLDNPITGIGFRSLEKVMGGSAHNGYLSSLAEIGLFGFSALLYLILSGTYYLWKKTKDKDWVFSHSILLGLCFSILFASGFEAYLFNVGNPTSLLFIVSVLSATLAPPKTSKKLSHSLILS